MRILIYLKKPSETLIFYRTLQSVLNSVPRGNVMRKKSRIPLLAAVALVLVLDMSEARSQRPGILAPEDVGLKVGEKIPEFELADQTGELRDFDSLKGPKGLMLVFHRSADW